MNLSVLQNYSSTLCSFSIIWAVWEGVVFLARSSEQDPPTLLQRWLANIVNFQIPDARCLPLLLCVFWLCQPLYSPSTHPEYDFDSMLVFWIERSKERQNRVSCTRLGPGSGSSRRQIRLGPRAMVGRHFIRAFLLEFPNLAGNQPESGGNSWWPQSRFVKMFFKDLYLQ